MYLTVQFFLGKLTRDAIARGENRAPGIQMSGTRGATNVIITLSDSYHISH